MLNGLLNSTVTIQQSTGQNDYAEHSFGDASTYSARVEFSPKKITTDQGSEKISCARIYLLGTVPIEVEDKITFSNSVGDSVSPKILRIDTTPDRFGINFITVVYV